MGIEFDKLKIWIVLESEIDLTSFINSIENEIVSQFIDFQLYRSQKKIEIIDKEKLIRSLTTRFPIIYGFYDGNIIEFMIEI